ncbi:hypothetical protein AVEN_203394-1 [Araneus ventricosus]|uniref:Serpin domain-containing protein n=1 Tax=Araneus ventricosus TaxID=182803 RepID=A0A4Y2KNW9_ARAVE|nr:hypothetical protein AVEN_203394-1 [Araneus ventricosus]
MKNSREVPNVGKQSSPFPRRKGIREHQMQLPQRHLLKHVNQSFTLNLLRTALTMRNISVFGAFFATCIAVSAGRIFSPEDMAKENLRKLALANNELAFNLHRRLASNSSKNVFFSPLSISTAFSMLLYGARGETAEV